MKTFILISPKNRSAYNFRGDLIKEIIGKGYKVIVTGPNQIGAKNITALGAEFVEISMNKNGINPISDLSYLWKLYILCKKEMPEATLGYTIKPYLYGSLAARLAGVNNVNAMVAGAGFLFASKSLKVRLLKVFISLLYKIGFGVAHHIIFQNIDDLNEFCGRGFCKREKCGMVNGSGVNMTKFTPSEYPAQPTFFMLGRFIHSKGVLDYLEAAKMVKEKYPQAHFMLLGKVEKIQDGITQEELDPYLNAGVATIYPETDKIAEFYAKTSVFVLPTAYREGTPRVILEAMASARAVITTFTPGCKETVQDGKNGFFVPVHAPVALAEKMIHFIEHPEDIEKMGKASYQLCKTKYEVSIINSVMMNLMQIE